MLQVEDAVIITFNKLPSIGYKDDHKNVSNLIHEDNTIFP